MPDPITRPDGGGKKAGGGLKLDKRTAMIGGGALLAGLVAWYLWQKHKAGQAASQGSGQRAVRVAGSTTDSTMAFLAWLRDHQGHQPDDDDGRRRKPPVSHPIGQAPPGRPPRHRRPPFRSHHGGGPEPPRRPPS